MSTIPSDFSLSSWEWMQMKVPVRPTPSLSNSKYQKVRIDEISRKEKKYKLKVMLRTITTSCILLDSETLSSLVPTLVFVVYAQTSTPKLAIDIMQPQIEVC